MFETALKRLRRVKGVNNIEIQKLSWKTDGTVIATEKIYLAVDILQLSVADMSDDSLRIVLTILVC